MVKGIYCYIDKKHDEVVYVGKDSSIDTNERHKQHFQPSRYDKQVINRVLQNNPDRYEYYKLVELSDDFSDNNLKDLERCFIKELNTYNYENPNCFNFTEGGDGTSGYTHSEEAKRKISENNKGMLNKNHTEESKRKMSITHSEKYNITGFYRVQKSKKSACKQGFTWEYRYNDNNNKRKSISSTDLKKLQIKVQSQGLEWRIINKANAEKSLEENYQYEYKRNSRNTTGFYRVSKEDNSSYKKGFRWCYQYRVNSQPKLVSSTDLNKLKEKVLKQGLEWEILDEKNAEESLQADSCEKF